jgi:hypothetical protein
VEHVADDGFRRLFLHELHDMRTHLNAVCGFAQLLQLDELTDLQRGHIGQILDASGRLQLKFAELARLASD